MSMRWLLLTLVPLAGGCDLGPDVTGLGDAFSCRGCWDVGAGGGSWGGPSPSAGTAYTVVSDDDVDDGACNPAHCSLREAINVANSSSAADTVRFNIPGPGPHTIQPSSALPTLTASVVVDGYTQPGASPNSNGPGMGSDAVVKIELDGTEAGPGAAGLAVTGGSSTVRGLVINRFDGFGIVISGAGGTAVQGNLVGTDVTGTVDLGNRMGGVSVSTSHTTIGGNTRSARNVISGNDAAGVQLSGVGQDPSDNVIQGNFIGTDMTGTLDLGNGSFGVSVFDNRSTTIGGVFAGNANVISGNGGAGIYLAGARETVVQGNFIGTDATGTRAVGNGGPGVAIAPYAAWLGIFHATDNLIGGTAQGAQNVITGNGGAGVQVSGDGAIGGNAVASNAIFSNGGLGIDLGPVGVTANDVGDTDSGPNGLQNFPVLASATTGGGGTTIAGNLNGAATTEFRLEIFANAACDPAGNGEGEALLGSAVATTDAGGSADFTVAVTTTVAVGQFITATATDPSNNTSEFSPCLQLTQ